MKVHLIGICGTGMGSLALLLQSQGHEVRGSDTAAYPPMGPRLHQAGIEVMQGFAASNLAWAPDTVVVGNVCRRDNPEARAAIDGGLAYRSFPAALAEELIGTRHSVVVAGTHGKTTTTALISYLLEQSGQSPGFLIGGVPADFDTSCRNGDGDVVVVEGDEYDSAFFDKRPKFVHYRPRTLVLTSIEFDHADIYADLEAVVAAFIGLCASVPPDGRILAARGTPGDASIERALAAATAPVERYGVVHEGPAPDDGWTARWIDPVAGRFALHREGAIVRRDLLTSMAGDHNLQNVCVALAVLSHLGVAPAEAGSALASFGGVRRRQEERGEPDGVLIIDDFAHHPTAVRETVVALRQRYPGRRLWILFEPRTQTSRRRIFQEAYAEALGGADRVVIAQPYGVESLPPEERMRPDQLVARLQAGGTWARMEPGADGIVALVAQEAVAGDVVAVFSNGGFDGIHQKLLDTLGARAASGADGEDGTATGTA